jgi:nitrate reductase NapAB chaperone NapD
MKHFILFLALSTISLGICQNSRPEIIFQDVVIDQINETVSITYDLVDNDNDLCSVWLKSSIDGGEFYEAVDNLNITGDIGQNINQGASKSMVWDYSTLTGSIFNVQLKLNASDGFNYDIQDFVDEVDSNELISNLEFIEGVRHFSANPSHLNAIRDSIDNIFNYYGLITERHEFDYNGNQGVNVIGRKPGLKDEAITFIIDGHYDGVSNGPAADDNGSAVSGMLEILRVLSQYDFEHSIRFIGFDFEELGLIGSQRYVQNAIKSYEDIQGVLNFEMIGYYSEDTNSQTLPNGFEILFPQEVQEIQDEANKGNFLVVVGNTNSNSLITDFENYAAIYTPDLRVISLEVPGNGQVAPDLRRSDHTPFWESGRKALMLTDGADTRNFNYHTAADSIGTLNFDFMTKNVKATLATLSELAIPISGNMDHYDLALLSTPNHSHSDVTNINIYPNPSNGKFTINIEATKSEKYRLEIFDLDGKLVSKNIYKVNENNILNKEIDLSNLSKGNYIAIFTTDDFKTSKSIIIK